MISAASGDDLDDAKDQVGSILRKRRHIPPGELDDFAPRDPREIQAVLQAVTGVLTALLAGVAAVSLVVGGIGIMNIMLVSVTERTREIGVLSRSGPGEATSSRSSSSRRSQDGAAAERGWMAVDEVTGAPFRPFAPGAEDDARVALHFARRVYRSRLAQRAFLQRMRTSTEKLLLRPAIWVVVREPRAQAAGRGNALRRARGADGTSRDGDAWRSQAADGRAACARTCQRGHVAGRTAETECSAPPSFFHPAPRLVRAREWTRRRARKHSERSRSCERPNVGGHCRSRGRSSGHLTRSAMRALMVVSNQRIGDTMHARAGGERFDGVFSITGAFDPIAASQLRARLAELPPEACVVLDFSRAWEVADLALAVLAPALGTTRHPLVLLRGLTQHQERMLQYLGIDPIIFGAPAREWAGQA